MHFDELLEQVKRLEEAEKLHLVQLLIDDLKLVGSAYEILMPFWNEAAARILQNTLQEFESTSQTEIE